VSQQDEIITPSVHDYELEQNVEQIQRTVKKTAKILPQLAAV
jgi:hypothetical protein